MSKLFYGVGVNDINHPSQSIQYGKIVICVAYKTWKNLLYRCYAKNSGFTVCEEWKFFSNFKKWFDDNYQDDYIMNVGLLGNDSKVYSPETVVFLDQMTHAFVRNSTKKVGATGQTGLTKQKQSEKYHVKCSNPFTGEQEHVCYEMDKDKAIRFLFERKHKFAKMIAEKQSNKKVADAILNLYGSRINGV